MADRTLRVLVAPDSFGGALDSVGVAAAIARGWSNVRRDDEVHLGDDPRWARAARLVGMEEELARAGYGEILELEPEPGEPLDLTPPAPPSRLAGFMGRARRRLG